MNVYVKISHKLMRNGQQWEYRIYGRNGYLLGVGGRKARAECVGAAMSWLSGYFSFA